jgi:myo-inositol-1(or 4)-monophosphatase
MKVRHAFQSAELDAAVAAVGIAGETLLQWQRPIDPMWKGRIDPVTEADRASESIILESLRRDFPDHLIVSEESSPLPEPEVRGKRRWYVDPLDGTVNFSRGLPHWCVSLAYVDESDATRCAVVYAPQSDELYCAVRGQGAALNGETIWCSRTDRLDRTVIASGFPYSFDRSDRTNVREWSSVVPNVLTVRCMGAAAQDLCEVARGRIDAFWEIELERWDIAAGALICAEAGALVTDLRGTRLDGPGNEVLAANPALHPAVLNLLISHPM